MSTLYGTHHFVTKRDAVLYYRDYHETTADTVKAVDEKIEAGEIKIGAPGPLKTGESLVLVDGGRRYAVAVED